MNTIFIGYDTKEAIAYHVCVNSIVRHAKNPLLISPLALNMLQYNESHNDGSNEFVYTRFLVPSLQNYKGWALFIDGDMVLKADINKLWDYVDNTKAVFVVKHDYKTKSLVKYLGNKNENYPRKNWSSVILWNCEHSSNKILTHEYIQNSTGSFLHRFSWLSDFEIGELPIEWNWLPDEFGVNENAKIIHYTLGTPCFNEYKDTTMSYYWHEERKLMENCLQYEPETFR